MTENKTNFGLLTEDQIVARLKHYPGGQAALARELHCSRSFVNQVVRARRSRPTNKMLDLIGVERKTVYVEKGRIEPEFVAFEPRSKTHPAPGGAE